MDSSLKVQSKQIWYNASLIGLIFDRGLDWQNYIDSSQLDYCLLYQLLDRVCSNFRL